MATQTPSHLSNVPLDLKVKLEGQVDEILEMYDCAENAYGYDHTRASGY